MRYGTVNSSELGDDWRPSAHLPTLSVGDRVRVTAPGTYNRLVGEITARWWTLDMFDVQLDAGGEVPFRPEELEAE